MHVDTVSGMIKRAPDPACTSATRLLCAGAHRSAAQRRLADISDLVDARYLEAA